MSNPISNHNIINQYALPVNIWPQTRGYNSARNQALKALQAAYMEDAQFGMTPAKDAEVKESVRLYMQTWVIHPLENVVRNLFAKEIAEWDAKHDPVKQQVLIIGEPDVNHPSNQIRWMRWYRQNNSCSVADAKAAYDAKTKQ